jgi:hypothetical protein
MNEQPQDAGQQDQAEQGLAQQERDDDLKEILKYIRHSLSTTDMKLLCSACGIDIRDVT